ncbi:hypothetical protein GTQ99_02660 [Kineococcus sp. T13]|uniref:hypothetical protein n=1 Tax=Kineococcus vitellinus TaxID=2696565 RepID=UPI001411C56B|nr:hypothetical protein [Kineococcus vitellinus]NAZ74327.1 hypothetical protein [Kineococcus vitellinus]
MTKDENRRRWAGTARTATAGALVGAIGGAVAGTTSLLGDGGFSTGAAVVFGGGFGAVFGALFGVATGAVGGCLAVHVVRRRIRLARTLLAVCSGVLIALATAWSLGPEVDQLGWIVLAGAIASTAAWLCAPWCLRPLRAADSPA